jgi:hypothetical protein
MFYDKNLQGYKISTICKFDTYISTAFIFNKLAGYHCLKAPKLYAAAAWNKISVSLAKIQLYNHYTRKLDTFICDILYKYNYFLQIICN